MVNSKILFGNIILILIILFTFYFIRTNIKISKESFSMNDEESSNENILDTCRNIINDSEDNINTTNNFDNMDNMDNIDINNYKNKDISICKYIAYENNSVPYLTKQNMKSYDAYKLCMNDPKCMSFSFNGRQGGDTSNVNFYSNNKNITENKKNWATENYPNLYIKKMGSCLMDKEISYMNPIITPQYSNEFINNYRDILNK